MFPESWLDDWLPTKWSRRLTMVTFAIAISAYGLPSFLPASFLPQSQQQVFLIRITLLLLTLLFGSWAVLISVLIAHKKLRSVPKRIFDDDLGAYKDEAQNIFYCAKCETTPLRKEAAGMYCVKCHILYQTQSQKDELEAEREAKRKKEDAKVSAFNNGRY